MYCLEACYYTVQNSAKFINCVNVVIDMVIMLRTVNSA